MCLPGPVDDPCRRRVAKGCWLESRSGSVFSKVTDRNDVASRIQGGLLADGVNSFLATFFNSPPNTTFSQNNGLIALTRCASRSVGFSCAFWLIILGVFGKFGALFAS